MLQNHSPFVEVMKSYFLAHPKIFFTYFFVFPAAPISVNPPPLVVFLLFFSSFPSVTHFSHLSLFLLVFVLSNFQFLFALLFCLLFFLLTASSVWNISCFSPFTIYIQFFCFFFFSFLTSVVFYFVSSPLHITVSVFAILHHLDCWNYFSLSHSLAYCYSVKDCF